jgi:hypothetical protein
MPLTKRQFELRVDEEMENWMRQVYDLLEGHRDLAYSSEELRQPVLGDDPLPSTREKFDRALNVLARIGAVDKRGVYDTDYYAFEQAFDTESWEPKVHV